MTLDDYRRRLSLLNRHGNRRGLADCERAFIRYARARCFAGMNRARATERRRHSPEAQ